MTTSTPKVPPRTFEINPADDGTEPLCFGLGGPPGSGKTYSALRLGEGFSRVRGGKPCLIDSEAGRARKYHVSRDPDGFDFDYLPILPPFKPEYFAQAIEQAIEKLKPSCIIVDNASDEHEGPGGVLEWHDEEVPKMNGNEWAAWNAPKKSRRVLTSHIQQIKIPIIMTFRARPKTKTPPGSRNPVAVGYVPIAGEELLGIMDLFCLLPPKSNGVATWSSDKAGEDFVIKLPHFLRALIEHGAPIDEALGERLARWQLGKAAPAEKPRDASKRTPQELVDAYVAKVGKLESLDALKAFQLEPGTVKFVAGIKEKHPALHENITDANSRRARELMPSLDDDDGETIVGDRESDMNDGDGFPFGRDGE